MLPVLTLQDGPNEWFVGDVQRGAKTAKHHFWVKFDDGEYKNPHLSADDPLASAQKNGYGSHWLLVKEKKGEVA